MKISIITPSYNSLNFLKDCHKSIITQKNADFEHIVVDGLSNDGTQEWANKKNIKLISEKDDGMWDAVNKGINIATGQIILQLNCDEQLLDKALETVTNEFKRNSNFDILVGDRILYNEDYSFNCFRKTLPIRKNLIISETLYLPTCGTFYKRKIFNQLKFDTEFKAAADADFVYKVIECGYRFKRLKKFTSLFMVREDNKQLSTNALREVNFLRNKYNVQSSIISKIKKYFLIILNLSFITKIPLKYHYYSNEEKNSKIIYFPNYKMKKFP